MSDRDLLLQNRALSQRLGDFERRLLQMEKRQRWNGAVQFAPPVDINLGSFYIAGIGASTTARSVTVDPGRWAFFFKAWIDLSSYTDPSGSGLTYSGVFFNFKDTLGASIDSVTVGGGTRGADDPIQIAAAISYVTVIDPGGTVYVEASQLALTPYFNINDATLIAIPC